MKLNFYKNDELEFVEVFAPCPGCDEIENLAIFTKVISYCNKRVDYHIGCNKCGWMGPHAKDPEVAAKLWDTRAIRSE